MGSSVDHCDISAVFARDVGTTAIERKYDGPRPATHVDLRDNALLIGRNREDFALFFAGHINFTVGRIHPNAFGFRRYLHPATRLPRAKIDNRHALFVLIGDKREFPIFADCKLLRIGADMPAIDQLARVCVDHPKAIRRFVCRRTFRIHARGHAR